jgi:hypothetical protein
VDEKFLPLEEIEELTNKERALLWAKGIKRGFLESFGSFDGYFIFEGEK